MLWYCSLTNEHKYFNEINVEAKRILLEIHCSVGDFLNHLTCILMSTCSFEHFFPF